MYLVAGVIVIIVIAYILFYNRLRKLAVKVEESSAGIDVALEKRYDLLSEELETVKKFLRHEYETYTAVVAGRAGQEQAEKKLESQNHLTEEALRTIDRQIDEQTAAMEKIRCELRGQQEEGKAAMGQAAMEKAADSQSVLGQKMNLLASIHHSLGGVSSAIDALSEQYPVLYSYGSVEHFQNDIFNTEEHLQAARRLYNANVSAYNQKLVSIPYVFLAKIHGMEKAAFYEAEDGKKSFRVNFD